MAFLGGPASRGARAFGQGPSTVGCRSTGLRLPGWYRDIEWVVPQTRTPSCLPPPSSQLSALPRLWALNPKLKNLPFRV